MSYAPSTKLSYSDGSATVLTGEMVMVTRGLGYGTMMKLADWLILADGREEIPLLVPPPQIAVGTKFKWVLGADTYRVAIQKKNGVLQVKSVTDGAGECHDDGCPCTPCAELRMVPPPPWRSRRPLKVTLFENYSAWLKSLPKGGKTTVTDPDKRKREQPMSQTYDTILEHGTLVNHDGEGQRDVGVLGGRIADRHRRQNCAIFALAIVQAFFIHGQETGEFHHLPRGAKRSLSGTVDQINCGPLHTCRRHLAGHRAFVDQVIQTAMISGSGLILGKIGWTNGLMGLLRIFRFGLVYPRFVGQIATVKAVRDRFTRG